MVGNKVYFTLLLASHKIPDNYGGKGTAGTKIRTVQITGNGDIPNRPDNQEKNRVAEWTRPFSSLPLERL